MDNREVLFRKNRPQINGYKAIELIEEHGEIVSMGPRPAGLDLFLLSFVSKNDTTVGPLALNPVVARELCRLLIHHGYGSANTDQAQ